MRLLSLFARELFRSIMSFVETHHDTRITIVYLSCTHLYIRISVIACENAHIHTHTRTLRAHNVRRVEHWATRPLSST